MTASSSPTRAYGRPSACFDPAGRKVYEFYRLTKTDKGWHADQASIFDLSSNKLRPDGWTLHTVRDRIGWGVPLKHNPHADGRGERG